MQTPKGKLRLLVVEDDADIADSVVELLGMLGHSTLLARDGDEALSLATRHHVDAVLLDWNLPGLSGLPLVGALRRATHTDLPIIVCSADPRSLDEARAASPYGVLPKPYSLPTLIESIRIA